MKLLKSLDAIGISHLLIFLPLRGENRGDLGDKFRLLPKSFFPTIILLLMIFSCAEPPTEDEKFAIFQERFEKTYQKVFPKRMETSVDSLVDFSLTDKEILRKVDFCKQHLNQLDNFDIAQLSKGNRAVFKDIFSKLKSGLRDMQQAANELTNKKLQ